jgi:hypothetical protein
MVHAGSRAPPPLGSAPWSASGCDLPSPLPAFVAASGELAAAAVERGDLAGARRLLEVALQVVEAAGAGPGLRLVEGEGRNVGWHQ